MNAADAARCWMCGNVLVVFSSDQSEPGQPPLRRQHFTFSLASLVLLVIAAAVWLAVVRQFPWLGVLLSVPFIPATTSAWIANVREKARGHPLPLRHRFSVFWLTATLSLVLTEAVVVVALVLMLPFRRDAAVMGPVLTLAALAAMISAAYLGVACSPRVHD